MAASTKPVDLIPEEDLEAGRGTLQERAKARLEQLIEGNVTLMAQLRDEVAEMRRFVSPRGSALPEGLAGYYKELGLPALNMNKILPLINNLCGREKVRRFEAKVGGRDNVADQGFADACNAAVKSIIESFDGEAVLSALYRQAHVGGLTATDWKIRVARKTPAFRSEKVNFDGLLIDMTDTSPNFSETPARAFGSWVDLWTCKKTYPQLAEIWEEIKGRDEYHYEGGNVWAAMIGGTCAEDGGHYRYHHGEADGLRWFRARDSHAWVVKFQWCDIDPGHHVRLPGELVEVWVALFGEDAELPFDDFDNPMPELAVGEATSPIVMEAMRVLQQALSFASEEEPPTVLYIMGALASLAEQLKQQRETAFRQGQLAYEQGQAEQPPQDQRVEGISREMSPEEFQDFNRGYVSVAFTEYLDVFDIDRETWYQSLHVGDMVPEVKVLRHGAPTLLPLVCYMEETSEGQLPHGTALILRDRQLYTNAFANALVYAAATMVKARLIIDKNKINDDDLVAQAELDLTSGKPAIYLPADSWSELPGGRDLPRGLERMFELLEQSVPAGIGQSDASTGALQSVARTAWRLIEQQTAQSEATIAEATDNLRQFRKDETRLILRLIFTYWSLEDFRRAAGVDYAQWIPVDRSRWWEALEWDLIVDEQPVTRHTSLAILELLSQNGMFQSLPQKALAKLAGPAIGSDAQQEWLSDLALQEPAALMQRLEQLLQLPEGSVTQMIQQLQQQPQEQQ